MNPNVKRIELGLDNLLAHLSLAVAVGKLEPWANIYTKLYMMKLRAM